MKLYWYIARRKPKADKAADGMYGYVDEPDYETIEKYDLRFVMRESWDDVTGRYFEEEGSKDD